MEKNCLKMKVTEDTMKFTNNEITNVLGAAGKGHRRVKCMFYLMIV